MSTTRNIIARLVPRITLQRGQYDVTRGKNGPLVGNVRRLWLQELRFPPPERQPPLFVPVVPDFPRLTPPGQLVSGLLRARGPGRGSSAFSALRRGIPHLHPT